MTTDNQLPAVREGQDYVGAYLDAIGGPEGRFCKFDKNGRFVTSDDGQEMDTSKNYLALWRDTRISWKKFNADGEPPVVHGGPLYDGYILPRREELGDTDEKEWPIGLDGFPADPWKHFIEIVLQRQDTAETFLFATSSKTGRKAVSQLLKHCQRSPHGSIPLVQLHTGSFKHRDPRIGQVRRPNFAVVGSVRLEAPPVDDELNDAIPF
jgi:hypothetical protein